MPIPNSLPRLRPLAVSRVRHEGLEYYALKDPLRLSEQTLLVPEPLGPLLMLLDGARTLEQVAADLAIRFGLKLEHDHILTLVATLSDGLLLEDDQFRETLHSAREAYRSAPFRPPALTPGVYPAGVRSLKATLRRYEQDADAGEGADTAIAGLITPHIDYHRGWRTYARLWRQAAPAIRDADAVVIFGTDHHGSPGALTLTRQTYATPWGPFELDQAVVDAMAEVLGEDAAFAEELHHRDEHSIELAAVWLHHMRDGKPCMVIPVLCGHPQPWQDAAGDLEGDQRWQTAMRALAALRGHLAGRRVLAVAAADLAHVGPAFGDPLPFTDEAKADVRREDDLLLAACDAGPAAVLQAVNTIDDRYRICGLSPIVLTLAFTGPARVEVTGYDQCPADHDGGDGSVVSVAGAILRAV